MVGPLSAAKGRFLNPEEEASAHFLFPRIGRPTQMVDSGDAAWHASGMAGNYFANLFFHGFEFEGGAPGNYSEPLTENQIEWGIRVTRWLRETHNSPLIYVRRETLWEHNEVAATACPSGRIPWARLIKELEDDMDEATVQRMIDKAFERQNNSKWRLQQIADNLPDLNQHLRNIVNGLIRASGGSGIDYTDAKAVEAIKDKLS
jgi:N-acetyl-anhydromuramyl-L-alanine amidase AmpD